MIVLHSGVYDGRVLLWGETSASLEAVLPTRRRGRKPEVSHPPPLPYDLEAKGLSVALREAGFSFAADPSARLRTGKTDRDRDRLDAHHGQSAGCIQPLDR